ncbi:MULTISPECIES: FAD-binding protein [unclassified Meiothermus]|uniref:FAD-binding protein n=1 Tax=unclassified Meiothermus TaxID=370471 RepID=UPI000D7C03C6|nr:MULTISPECIES: FAD-binding protein [unclassified Meiothermus]PZA08778.1 2-hydroxy-acid oxidase [Meiothermus sp. Pnk-1]RYM40600.1 FAD-binding protein [Meiothermus sp. PNK-Is4]
MSEPALCPTNPAELQEAVRTTPKLLPRGGGTKTALSSPREGRTVLDMTGLRGVKEYDPAEYVLVALAGTPLAEVEALLARHGQYLPFDPPFAPQGATLGGTVAAGLSGPMRQRYGGVRDFILGVQFVDGEGNLVRGGGKVVKNAAGFDLPKLMVGSLGRLGVLVELAFKVFPFPRATATLKVSLGRLEEALEAMYKLAASPLEFYALDLEPPATLTLRIGGLPEALPARLERLRAFLGHPPGTHLLEGEEERGYWRSVGRLEWGHGYLVKVPIQPGKIAGLERELPAGMRRYIGTGNLLYLHWPDPIEDLDGLLKRQGLRGLVLRGEAKPTLKSPLIGVDWEQAFARRVTAALDPHHRFS